MTYRKSWQYLALSALIAMLSGVCALAQSTTLAAGLKSPSKIVITDGGNLIVAESGTGHNDGRVSLVDRCGNRRTLIDGLPSGSAPPEDAPSGPAGLALHGRTLFISIGAGDATINGPFPGSEIPNPNGPSSPIFSSVLTAEFGVEVDYIAGGITLSTSDHVALKGGAKLARQSAQGDAIIIKLLADFPDFALDPFVIARASNTFALALDGNQLYVADASQDLVNKVNTETGAIEVFAHFAPLPNPLPFGPPVMDAVPDGLRVYNNQLLVTFLTGFPFADGLAEVRSVALGTGNATTFIGGLTTAIDVLPAKTRYGGDQFFVLEISTDLNNGAPGRLLKFASPTTAPVVIAGDLIGPVGMTRDARSGDIFVTENFTGRIIQILGNELDICLQDDDSGDMLRFSSQTGEYLFVSCKSGVAMTGRGKVERQGCATELSDPFVAAVIDRCLIAPQNRGAATIRRTPFGGATYIHDSDTTNNTCTGH